MKKILLASAAMMAFIACSKEETPQANPGINNNVEAEIITCTFENNEAATKTTLDSDGKKPLWAAGDVIKLYDNATKDNHKTITLAANGTEQSSDNGVLSSDGKSFTFLRPSGWTNVCAVYPASACATDFTSTTPKINFSGQDGSFAKANICAGKASNGTIQFKNIGAVLKFSGRPADVGNIVIPVAELKNDYTISYSGEAVTPDLSSVTATNATDVTLNIGKTTDVYIGVPEAAVSANSAFVYRTSAKAILGSVLTGSSDKPLSKNMIYNLGSIASTSKNGKLPGIFTVADGKTVRFSKGNLQAKFLNSSSCSWIFADNQYDFIGGHDSETSSPVTGNNKVGSLSSGYIVDLFGWVGASSTYTGVRMYGISNSTDDAEYGNKKETQKSDWGTNAIENGGNSENLWRTLSASEWTYLLNSTFYPESSCRSDKNRFAKAMVNSIKGLVIFPDGYNGDVIISGIRGISTVNSSDAAYPEDSVADWPSMECAGCVFLPAAAYRKGTDVIGTAGNYWSSTCVGTINVYYLTFGSSIVNTWYPGSRSYGRSVRLVCDTE